MPASSPRFGISKIALTMARLIVNNEDRGIRFFIVPLCNEHQMYQGVESISLPRRSGTQPFDWSLTRFNDVHLPPTALVGSDIREDTLVPVDQRQAWWSEVQRVPIGTLVVAAPWISALKATAFIGGRYSAVRSILGKGNHPTPILSFRTQQWPILNATAVAMVLDRWYPAVIDTVMNQADYRIQHAVAAIAKTTICRYFQRCVGEVAERCGAQGTFEYNYMAKVEVSIRIIINFNGLR